MSIPLGVFVVLQPEAPSVEEIMENIKYTDRCLKQERKGNEGKRLGAEYLKHCFVRKKRKIMQLKFAFQTCARSKQNSFN